MVFGPIGKVGERLEIVQRGREGKDGVFKILDTDQKIQDNGEFVLENVKGDISFKDVFFAYNKDQWVLKGINFDIEAGKTLALVGETGAGKTSEIGRAHV